MMEKYFCFGKKDFCENTDLCVAGCQYCDGSGGEYRKAPMTNADHIRAMTDDELNNFLRKVAYCMDKCPYEYGGKKSLGWLQQPAEEDTHE